MLRHLTIKSLAIFAALTLAMLMLIQGGLIYWKGNQIQSALKHVVYQDTQVRNSVYEMRINIIQVQQWLTDISATRGLNGLDDGFDKAKKNAEQFKQTIAQLERLDVAHQKEYALLNAAFDQYYLQGQKMARAYIEAGPESGNLLMPDFDRASEGLYGQLEPVLKWVDESSNGQVVAVEKLVSVQLMLILAFTFLSLLTVVVLIVYGRKLLILPLNELAQLLKQSSGSLSVQFPENQFGELGVLARGLNHFVYAAENNRQTVRVEIGHLKSAIKQLSASISTTQGVMKRQYAETDQLAVAMEEMSATVQEVARSAIVAADSVTQANTTALQGRDVVSATVRSIEMLAGDIQQTGSVIARLENFSTEIGQVASHIGEIAEQTNLLALNAAIEAARAGEQGRGFAVVADEVRNLSQRTGTLTQQIDTIIQNLQQGAHEAASTMQANQKAAAGSVVQVGKADTRLIEITQQVSNITDMNNQIATAAEEQSAVAQEMSNNVSNINDVTVSTLSEVDKLLVASRSLEDVVARLSKLAA